MSYQYDRAHMFQVIFDPNPASGLFDWMELWLLNWSPWEDERHGPNELPELITPEAGEGSHYHADWWFSFAEDPEIVYGHLIGSGGQITELTARTDWARVGYHECTHPGADGPCSWDEVRDHGTVPGYIEDMSP